ncbi:hypothetical protein RSAG8_07728, partial [Rhizoctonia solani AG-8 WAC10335]
MQHGSNHESGFLRDDLSEIKGRSWITRIGGRGPISPKDPNLQSVQPHILCLSPPQPGIPPLSCLGAQDYVPHPTCRYDKKRDRFGPYWEVPMIQA